MATRPVGVDKSLAEQGIVANDGPVEETGPLYRVLGDTKIPVSMKHGALWQSRRDQGLSARSDAQLRWDEAIRYYENDQVGHRTGSKDNASGNALYAKRLNSEWSETENVVFANSSIMVPMLYSKNPTVSCTTENEANTQLALVVQKLVNKLISMKTAPGIGLKNKMRRVILSTLLTNSGWVKINWITKQASSEQALVELQKLTQELVDAKTPREIKAVEGKIAALEETVSMLSPSGPSVSVRSPHHIITDPTASEPDGSDSQWMMEWDYLPTDYINATYGKPGVGNTVVSVYEPTHVMLASANSENGQGVEDQVNNFKLIPDEGEAKPSAYGYKSEAQLKSASMTKVWWVWDKTTRRVFMYADNNWKWPIWVWDDPLKLPRFFPYFRLWFHEGTNSQNSKGEVTYYLDQQDAINEINDEVRRGRNWAKRNIFYNKKAITQEDVEAVLKGPDGTARGVNLEEGMTLDKAIMSITPPALKFPELFNTDSKFAAINRVTGINDAQRGAQFKTNTTNQAVQSYQANSDIRVDERTDLIEDFIADVCWNVAMLCLMNWETADVAQLLGQQAEGWQRVTDNRQFDVILNMRVEAGSIGKPNSKAMQQQAIQLGQVMGQFANSAPMVIPVMLKMFQRAFEGQVVIEDGDWDGIIQSIEQSLAKAGAGPSGAGGEGGGSGGSAEGGPASTDETLKAQVAQQIAALPAKAKAALEQAIQSGVPPAEALKEIQKQVQQAQP